MRALYPAVSVISVLLVQGAVAGDGALWSARSLFSPDAQSTRPMLAAQPNPATAQATPAPTQGPAAAPPPPERTETTNYENWILSCREFIEGPKKRSCAMTVAVRKADTNRPVLSWTVRQGDKGQLTSVIETLPGLSITPGIQLKLESSASPRKIPIEICEPNWCSGSLPMDKAFIHELSTSSKVTIIITSSVGQPVTFEFPVKGFEKAYAKM
jgi:invasion protein IalB